MRVRAACGSEALGAGVHPRLLRVAVGLPLLCGSCRLRQAGQQRFHLLHRQRPRQQVPLAHRHSEAAQASRAATRSRCLRPPRGVPSLRASVSTARTISRFCGFSSIPFTNDAVDLQRVERHRAQVRQRRIAGAEVVDREAHAERGAAASIVCSAISSCDISVALGDLEHQLLGRHLVFSAAPPAPGRAGSAGPGPGPRC